MNQKWGFDKFIVRFWLGFGKREGRESKLFLAYREGQQEEAAFARSTFDLDPPVMNVHDMLYESKPQACSTQRPTP